MDSFTDLITATTASPDAANRVPGLSFQVVDRNGVILNSTVSGVTNIDTNEPITNDSIFWVASLAKLVTAIALMQLFEQGKADLDSADQLEDVCPELKAVKILEGFDEKGKPILREKKNRITLRLLDSHQSGFGYSFLNEDLWRYCGKDDTVDEMSGGRDHLSWPLIFEPGTSHAYGSGVQWVTVFIERLTGKTLEEYLKENVYTPLGLKNTSMFLNSDLRKRLVTMHRRDADGSLHTTEPLFQSLRKGYSGKVESSGEGGLVTTTSEYCQILATVLNDGVSPTTQARILRKETIDLMFTNQVPDFTERFGGAGFVSPRSDIIAPWLANGIPAVGPQGWGLNFALSGKTEGNLTTAWAPGVANLFWSLDREKGVGCALFGQIIPLGDPVIFTTWGKVLEKLYA